MIEPQHAPADRTAKATAPRATGSAHRARAASMIGTMVEAYDFALYGTAAGIVFPMLFFGSLRPETGATIAFIILLGGYVARPLGGVLFGHFGDRYGRRQVLFITLLIMGVVSFAMGLLPTAAQAGIIAPIALVTLRLLQGVAYGGEWGGAMLMAMEHSPEGRRGLGASIAAAGGPAGSLMAALTLAIVGMLPDEQFFAWGWRLPFLLSLGVVLFGLWLRLGVEESPDFQEAAAKNEIEAAPFITILRHHPMRVVSATTVGIGTLFIQGLLAAFMVPHLIQQGHLDRSSALLLLSLSSFFQIFSIPAFAALSDRVGRRRWLLIANGSAVVLIWPVLLLFSSGNIILIGLAFILGNSVLQAATFGPFGAYLGEKFSVRTRYTGVSVSFQLAAILGAGMAPLIAQLIMTESGSLVPIFALISGLLLIACLALILSARQDAS